MIGIILYLGNQRMKSGGSDFNVDDILLRRIRRLRLQRYITLLIRIRRLRPQRYATIVSFHRIRRLGSQRYATFVSLRKIRWLKPQSSYEHAMLISILMAELDWGKTTRKEEAVQRHSAGRTVP